VQSTIIKNSLFILNILLGNRSYCSQRWYKNNC